MPSHLHRSPQSREGSPKDNIGALFERNGSVESCSETVRGAGQAGYSKGCRTFPIAPQKEGVDRDRFLNVVADRVFARRTYITAAVHENPPNFSMLNIVQIQVV